MNRLWICERGCEVKCPVGVPDLLFTTQGNGLRNVAHQRRLNAERLWFHVSLPLVDRVRTSNLICIKKCVVPV